MAQGVWAFRVVQCATMNRMVSDILGILGILGNLALIGV